MAKDDYAEEQGILTDGPKLSEVPDRHKDQTSAVYGYGQLADSGTREKFETGAVRDIPKGKGRFDAISPIFLERLAIHMGNADEKYKDAGGCRNWEKGMPASVYWNAHRRHGEQYLMGNRDEDHLSAIAWNMMCVIHTLAMVDAGLLPKELADLPNFGYPSLTAAINKIPPAANKKISQIPHLATCGTSYRGCDPDCPKEKAEQEAEKIRWSVVNPICISILNCGERFYLDVPKALQDTQGISLELISNIRHLGFESYRVDFVRHGEPAGTFTIPTRKEDKEV